MDFYLTSKNHDYPRLTNIKGSLLPVEIYGSSVSMSIIFELLFLIERLYELGKLEKQPYREKYAS
jgi:hypothetical protein